MSLDDALAGIWERGKPAMRERLAALDRHLAAPGDEAAVADARRAAHQMAGSLGTFGIAGGSETARELEAELEGTPDPDRVAALAERLAAILAPHL